MKKSEHSIEVRGAQDLVELWRTLPVSMLRYPASTLASAHGTAVLSDILRARAWREHCAAATTVSCVESGNSCAMVDRNCCRADVLFPAQIGGGAQKWRMATMFLQWRPSVQELHLISVGETACEELDWAARCLREHHELDAALSTNVTHYGDLEFRGTKHWRLVFVTPWLVFKSKRTITSLESKPDAIAIAHEIGKSLRERAKKFTALCSREATWQKLTCHLAHHVTNALLPTAFSIDQVRIEPQRLKLSSRGNGGMFNALVWNGDVTLSVDETLLPWLSILSICGGGENADKGFGSVELIPQ